MRALSAGLGAGCDDVGTAAMAKTAALALVQPFQQLAFHAAANHLC